MITLHLIRLGGRKYSYNCKINFQTFSCNQSSIYQFPRPHSDYIIMGQLKIGERQETWRGLIVDHHASKHRGRWKSKSTIFAQRKLLSTWLGCWICLWMELRWQSLIVWFMSVVDPTWLFLSKNLVVFGRLLGCLRVAEQLSSPCCSYFTLRCSQTECDKRWTKTTASQYIKRLLKKRDD